ncbi:hypothetical protein B0H11DRAFT_2007049 [Mycena galericulata]|nr:hypothetical protein B0H11DRAFT_2007049 [Mycena galericulata]
MQFQPRLSVRLGLESLFASLALFFLATVSSVGSVSPLRRTLCLPKIGLRLSSPPDPLELRCIRTRGMKTL